MKSLEIKLQAKDLDEGLKAAGSNHRYQFFLMFMMLFLKIVTDSFYAPLPYFFMDPKINCWDEKTQTYSTDCKLSDVCKNNENKAISQQTKYELFAGVSPHYSWVTDFNIYCDFLKIGILASSASIGNLMSNIVGPLLTENIGRVKTLTIILIFDVMIKTSLLFTHNLSAIYVILLLMNLTNNTVYNTISIYLNEMVDPEKRGLYSCLFNSLYGISGIIYTVIFNLTFDWRILQYVSIGASVISLILNVSAIKESIRFLFQKKRNEEIIETLEYIATFNSRKEEYSKWRENIIIRNDEHNLDNVNVNNNDNSSSNPISLIFKKSSVVFNFFTFCIVSLVTMSGLIYNAIEVKTTTDTFLFPIIFYFTDFVIILTTGFLIDLPIFGRKRPAIFFSILGGFAYFLKYYYIVLHGESASVFMIDYMVRFCVSISFNILIGYNLEIYSTDIRATAFNINKLFSRIGDFTLPLILSSNRKLATGLVGGGYLIMSVFVMKLKETRGVKLKENVDDESLMEEEEKQDVENIKGNVAENVNNENGKDIVKEIVNTGSQEKENVNVIEDAPLLNENKEKSN